MILVTGANGNLGAAALAALRARSADATGGSRTPGEGTRRLDFDDRASLDLTGVSTLVLVSAGYAEDDRVVARHAAVLDAAVRDGVRHVVYTSLTSAGDHLGFALAHRATERLLRVRGLPYTVLRNGLYAELFGALLMWADDEVESAFGDGALAAVTRADLAEPRRPSPPTPSRTPVASTTSSAPRSPPRTWPRSWEPSTARSAWPSTGADFSTRRPDCSRSSRR
ncbi:NmrA family NAD(P)-binding protein [Nocardiopsis sp. CNR-923]|uniref:NmrA family NAD(P)-binding protein n=1 Tax=Nocardiopsis sp. CNR-923 TaxID=1904965 RepID=UPI000ABDD946|nr:NmrA family NAD(P)-binding protein [Nocardiopsis sp. CNR-923]